MSSWTAPSHASLFTGLHPGAHGTTQEDWRLREGIPTLAEQLGAAGYRTIGITENPVLSRANGFHRGFSEYHETYKMKVNDLERALQEHLEGEPVSVPLTNPIGCNVKWEGKDPHWMPAEACDLFLV